MAAMIAISLQSGSNGNCVYVEGGGVRVLFDAGISGLQAQQRLASHGRDIRQVDAVILSHDHADHARCAGVYQRKFNLPLYVTHKTLKAAQNRPMGRLGDIRFFEAGATLDLGGLQVQTIPTPHDAADGVAFVAVAGGKRLGILTDLGHMFDSLRQLLPSLDAAFLESNYDPEMLRQGPYPEFLQERIRGPHGHLSNDQAAELLAAQIGGGLRWACLAHLSEHNNHPDVAMGTHRRMLGDSFPLAVASRHEPSGVFEI